MSLLCPKCMNPMRQYERNRVIVDQCTECGGLFLDRGELETLAAAERSYYGETPAGPAPAGQAPGGPAAAPAAPIYDNRRYDQPPPGGYVRRDDDLDRRYDQRPYPCEGYARDDRYREDDGYRGEDRYRSDDAYRGKSKKRKARSFLEELFDD